MKVTASPLKSFRSIILGEARSASVYTILNFVSQLSLFLLVPLFWKKLTPTDYGLIATIDIMAVVFSIFAGLSLEQCIPRFFYEWPDQHRRRNLGAIWFYHWSSTILLGLLVLALLWFFSKSVFPDVEYYPYIVLGMINRILLRGAMIPNQTLRILRKPMVFAAYSLFNLFTTMGMAIYFVLYLDEGLYGYFIAGVYSAGLQTVASSILMLFYATPCLHSDGLRESFRYALPMIPSTIIASFSNTIDRFLLQRYASLEVLGLYSLATKFAKLIFMFHESMKLSYIPFLFNTVAESTEDRAKNLISRINLYYIIPIFMSGIAVSVFISDFVYFIDRPDYFPIIEYVPIILLPWTLITFFVYFMPGLLVSKRTDLLWIPSLAQLIVVSIFGFLLIPRYNLWGIIVTLYLNHIVFVIVNYILSERHYPLPTQWYKVWFLLGTMTAFIFGVNAVPIDNLVLRLAFKALMILVYGGLGLVVASGLSRSWRYAGKLKDTLLGA
ncbi:MAG: lipopolysaccharide biosynthesis protein [Longimicrobiales bacterium]